MAGSCELRLLLFFALPAVIGEDASRKEAMEVPDGILLSLDSKCKRSSAPGTSYDTF